MITDSKVTEIYCFADDFCKYFSSKLKTHQLVENYNKNVIIKKSVMSEFETIIFWTLSHLNGYRSLQHLYLSLLIALVFCRETMAAYIRKNYRTLFAKWNNIALVIVDFISLVPRKIIEVIKKIYNNPKCPNIKNTGANILYNLLKYNKKMVVSIQIIL